MQTAKRFLNRYASSRAIQEVMKKFEVFVPSEEIIMLGGMILFMYIAMRPII